MYLYRQAVAQKSDIRSKLLKKTVINSNKGLLCTGVPYFFTNIVRMCTDKRRLLEENTVGNVLNNPFLLE